MRSPEFLRKQASRCRRLANQVITPGVADQLNSIAAEYEAEAAGSLGSEPQMQAGDEPDSDEDQQQQS
jgi:hypothetical protein